MTIHDYTNIAMLFVGTVFLVFGLIAVGLSQQFVDESESKPVRHIALVFMFFSIVLLLSVVLENIA